MQMTAFYRANRAKDVRSSYIISTRRRAKREETGMTPNTTQPTAKIYQFPVGGRAALVGRSKPTEPMLDYAVSGAGWYHEAAIEETKRGSEH